ncbi:MAG TPA: ATP-binding protein [Syntrophorhabdaceae bacterium]|nr:ATP-binding protein [Syntrophorhabdaceae bacterium]
MKCRVCGKPASINLRSYKTALCEEDFIAFLEKRVSTTIKKYRLIDEADKPVVAVSGGKDSLSLWYMMNRLGYAADGIYVDLGIEGYSERSLEKIMQMADMLQRKAYIFHVRNALQKGIDGVAKVIRRPTCSACGTIKRYIMNRICIEKGRTVLATGHNLDDEASALFGNVLYWKKEYLWKKNVVLEAKEDHLAKKIKPFFLCSEREIAAYAIMKGIDYIYEECPFSKDAKTLVYKGILNRIEESSPGTKIMFVKGYLNVVKEKGDEKEDGREGRYCQQCGYPTFSDKCSFCRLLDKFGTGRSVEFDQYG